MLLTTALGVIIWLIAEGFINKGGCSSYVDHYLILIGIIVCVWFLNFKNCCGWLDDQWWLDDQCPLEYDALYPSSVANVTYPSTLKMEAGCSSAYLLITYLITYLLT